MVVFTCQNCGESLKKASVEKHYNVSKCRNKRPYLTCVDCLKDFYDYEYSNHFECMTELERYSAKGAVIKKSNGKEKQQQYISGIQNLLNTENLSGTQRQILDLITQYSNVPRKQAKFLNFMNNVGKTYKFRPESLVSVFKLLENVWAKERETLQTNTSLPSCNKTSASVEQNSCDSSGSKVENDNQTKNKNDQETKKKLRSPKEAKEDQVNINNSPEDSKENDQRLSKKQLKKQKKYQQYLAELENESKNNYDELENKISNANEPEEMETAESCEKRNKKSKKIKNKQEKMKLVDDDSVKNTDAMEEDVKEGKSKKHKKRKVVDVVPEIAEKKKKMDSFEGEIEEVQQAFDWAEVIVKVLQSRAEKELPLKRLGKKVITEYQTVKPDHHTYEQLLAKFNKKVKKTPGVRILKDKAKLAE